MVVVKQMAETLNKSNVTRETLVPCSRCGKREAEPGNDRGRCSECEVAHLHKTRWKRPRTQRGGKLQQIPARLWWIDR